MVGFKAWGSVQRLGARASAWLLFGAVLSAACAGKSSGSSSGADPCPPLCEAGAKCPGAPPLTQSCDDTCLGEDFVADSTGCHALYQKSLACTAKLKNVCTALVDCSSEITAAHNCEVAYCNGHPGTDFCATVM